MQNKAVHASFHLVITSLLLLLLHGLAEAHNEAVHIRVRSTCQLQSMFHSLQTQQQPPLAHVHLHVHSFVSFIRSFSQSFIHSFVQRFVKSTKDVPNHMFSLCCQSFSASFVNNLFICKICRHMSELATKPHSKA